MFYHGESIFPFWSLNFGNCKFDTLEGIIYVHGVQSSNIFVQFNFNFEDLQKI
jgi:hypothetical protein